MIYAGIALIVAAVALYVLAQRSAAKARRITATQNLTPAELLALHREVVGDADVAGAFIQTADSSGAVRCDAPLTAPMSSTPACTTGRRSPRRSRSGARRPTAQGRRTHALGARRPRRVRRRAAHDLRALRADAAVAVAGEGAKFDRPVQTVERFEPHHGPARGRDLDRAGLTFGARPAAPRLSPCRARVAARGARLRARQRRRRDRPAGLPLRRRQAAADLHALGGADRRGRRAGGALAAHRRDLRRRRRRRADGRGAGRRLSGACVAAACGPAGGRHRIRCHPSAAPRETAHVRHRQASQPNSAPRAPQARRAARLRRRRRRGRRRRGLPARAVHGLHPHRVGAGRDRRGRLLLHVQAQPEALVSSGTTDGDGRRAGEGRGDDVAGRVRLAAARLRRRAGDRRAPARRDRARRRCGLVRAALAPQRRDRAHRRARRALPRAVRRLARHRRRRRHVARGRARRRRHGRSRRCSSPTSPRARAATCSAEHAETARTVSWSARYPRATRHAVGWRWLRLPRR